MNRITVFPAIICFCFSVLFISCQTKKQEKVQNDSAVKIFDRETIVELSADCYIAEGEIFYAPEDSDKQAVCLQIYSNLFDKYHITKDEYMANCRHYFKDEEGTEQFMQDVMQKVAEKRQKIEE